MDPSSQERIVKNYTLETYSIKGTEIRLDSELTLGPHEN